MPTQARHVVTNNSIGAHIHCSAHFKNANNGIPIEPTLSSVSGALMEQLIFEFASLSSCPTKCTDFLRNLISVRTAILHYLNNYRTIAATNTKASTQELELVHELIPLVPCWPT